MMNEAHFLVAPDKLRRLVAALELQANERVVELGAGVGSVAAALPTGTTLTLVELEPALARGLRRRFPGATVLEGDALELLPELGFDVLLSNLPQALSGAVLGALAGQRFRRAALALKAGQTPAVGPALTARRLTVLCPEDFAPPQPFASEIWLLDTKKTSPGGLVVGGADGI